MVDFIYINKDGENEELRYSIRSVVANTNNANIIVVGGKPNWYVGEYYPVENVGNKFKNITECYKQICKISYVKDFIAMNDDFFILNRINNVSYFYDGLLIEKAEAHGSKHGATEYFRVLTQADKYLKKAGIEKALNYDIHTPMLMNKDKLSNIVEESYAPRSLYGNIFNVGGIEIKDVKVYKDTMFFDINSDFISTEDNTFEDVYAKVLKDKFKNKTQYEK